jgi:hypothetical protein
MQKFNGPCLRHASNRRSLGDLPEARILLLSVERHSFRTSSIKRLDNGARNLFEYFFQGDVGLVLRPSLRLRPIHRYQRYPSSATAYENRVLLNATLNRTVGRSRPNLRTLFEGCFPKTA